MKILVSNLAQAVRVEKPRIKPYVHGNVGIHSHWWIRSVHLVEVMYHMVINNLDRTMQSGGTQRQSHGPSNDVCDGRTRWKIHDRMRRWFGKRKVSMINRRWKVKGRVKKKNGLRKGSHP